MSREHESFKEFLLFGTTYVNIEDVSDEDYVDLLLSVDAYVTKETLTPQEIIEKYSEVLTDKQKQIIYEWNKI